MRETEAQPSDDQTTKPAKKLESLRRREAIQKLDDAGADRFLRQGELLALLGISRPTLWQWRKKGIFPDPDAKLGPLLLGWRRSTYERWLRGQKSGSPEAA